MKGYGISIKVEDQCAATYLINNLWDKNLISTDLANELIQKALDSDYPIELEIDELKLADMIKSPLLKPFKGKIRKSLENILERA